MNTNRPHYLVLVDNRVSEYSIFVDSCNPDTTPIIIDYEKDTFGSIIERIQTIGLSFDSVAYIAHGHNDSSYSYMKKETSSILSDVETSDPNLESWKPFFVFVSQIPALQTFDFLGCDLYSFSSWRYVFDKMSQELGITVRASSDKTGNVANGGNWFLEKGGVDVKDIYFNDEILSYTHLLQPLHNTKLSFIGDKYAGFPRLWNYTSGKVTNNYTGNVGVGIRNPVRRLEISGSLFVSNSISYGSIAGNGSNPFNLWTSTGSALYYNIGNVGIGTSTPVSRLEISGSIISNNLLTYGSLSAYNTIFDVSGNITSGQTVVTNPLQATTFTYYGNIALNTASYSSTRSGNITLQGGLRNIQKVAIGKSTSSTYSLDVSGDVYALNNYISYTNLPSSYYEVVRAYDIPTNESTTYSPYLSTYFAYIDTDRTVVVNSIGGDTGSFAGAGQSVAFLPRKFKLPNGVLAEKLYTTSTNIFILSDQGTVFSMGHNAHGNCGVGLITSVVPYPTAAFVRDSSNVLITRKIRKIINSELESTSYYALTVSGDLYATGANQYGQLSNGTTTNTGTGYPNLISFSGIGQVRGLVRDAVTIGSYYSDGTTGYQTHALGVLDVSGYVWCCGYNGYGQLGQGNTTSLSNLTRAKVSAGVDLSNIVAIYGSGNDTVTSFIALSNTGKIYVWGRNRENLRFDGSTTGSITYAKLVNTFIPNSPDISRVWTATHDMGDIFVQATNGLVYGTGYGTSLGISDIGNLTWVNIPFFNTTTRLLVELYTGCTDSDVNKVAAFAITRNTTTDEYSLWASGYNLNGMLGFGTRDSSYMNLTWNEVAFPAGLVKRIKRVIVNAHGTRFSTNTGTTYILLNSGEIFFAGRNIPLVNGTGTGDTNTTPLFRLLTINNTPEYN
jgi:alpha-tubulin suppressor-like RCC1 family protein